MELFTPGTGFIDLDIKIAYGLCRLGFEAGAGDMSITPMPGGFKIDMDVNPDELPSAYKLLFHRLLSGKHLYKLPGIQAKYIDNYPVSDLKEASLIDSFLEIYSPEHAASIDFSKNKMCGHDDIPSFGGTSGLILAASTHAGMPYKSGNLSQSGHMNTKLCELCGYITVMGILSGVFRLNMGSNLRIVTTPIPSQRIGRKEIELLFSSKLVLENSYIKNKIPLTVLPLSLMARFPSLTDVLSSLKYSLHIVVFESGQTDRVNGIELSQPGQIAKFLSKSTYNVATVDECLKNDDPYIEPLQSLNRVLTGRDTDYKRHQLMVFCRHWVSRVNRSIESGKSQALSLKILLYKQTVNYLLKEEAMLSPEIIENDAVRSFARTMRFFNSDSQHLNYTFVDNIRNASSDSGEFEKTIEKMLRSAQSLRLSLEKGSQEVGESKPRKFINIPSEKEFNELIRLASKDFNQVKTALVCLSLCRPEYRGKMTEEEVGGKG